MSDKTESEEVEEQNADGVIDDTVEIDVEHLIEDLERADERGASERDQPARRRVEEHMERKRAEKELDDLYDFDADPD